MIFWNRVKHIATENRKFYIITTASGLLAGIISLAIGLRQSVWFDEAYSILVAKHPLGELLHLTALDVHPPLYYILLKIWAGLFGWGELALRSLSVLALVAAVIMAGFLIKRLFNTRIALYATPLLALAPLLLRYGFEIRMYALGSLIGVVATYLLVRAVQANNKDQRGWLIAYALTITVGLYVQYFLILLWLAHAVWLIIIYANEKHLLKTMLPYIYAFAVGALLFLPWLPTFIGQAAAGTLAPIGKALNFEQLAGIITFNTVFQPADLTNMAVTFALIALIITLIYVALKNRSKFAKYRTSWQLLICYFAIPILAVMLLSLVTSPYTERYLSHVAIGLIMLIACLTALYLTDDRIKNRSKVLVAIIVFGCFLIGTLQLAKTGNFNFQRWEHPSINQAAASIENCGAGAQIIAAAPYEAIELSYYLPHCDIYFVSPWPTLGGGYALLSGSNLQIKSIDNFTAPSIIFIRDGHGNFTWPSDYRQVSSQQFDSVNVSYIQRI